MFVIGISRTFHSKDEKETILTGPTVTAEEDGRAAAKVVCLVCIVLTQQAICICVDWMDLSDFVGLRAT
jgi:hypothetical protein